MRVLGIDPGYAIVGYGVVEYQHGRYIAVDYGAITTDADMPYPQRFSTYIMKWFPLLLSMILMKWQ